MDRRLVYYGALSSDIDFNQQAQFGMISDGFLAASVMGQNSWAAGLTLAATAPASMSLVLAPGAMGAMSVVDQTNPGSSAIADATDALMKVGNNLTATTIGFTAPSTTGQSQIFLIQAQMQENDVGATTLQYWNKNNPTQPLAGPGGSGASQNTLRVQRVVPQVVAGAPATTGSQVAPSATEGWEPLYLITLAAGQATITASSWSTHPNAPFVDPLGTGNGLRTGRLLNIQTFTSSGTYVPTPGMATAIIEAQGGGGAGGGSGSAGSGNVSLGASGSAGTYAMGRFTASSIGASQAVTVGSGGVGVSAAAGGAGGASSVGSLIIAPGGVGGGTLTNQSPPTVSGNGNHSAAATGANITSTVGATASITIAVSSQIASVAAGGTSAFGSGAYGISINTAGVAAVNSGSGGGGTCVNNSGGSATGGNGAAGIVIVWEYS